MGLKKPGAINVGTPGILQTYPVETGQLEIKIIITGVLSIVKDPQIMREA
jgi:hypothetical protein